MSKGPQLDSPRMALGRQTALLAAFVAAVLAISGCGGDDSSAGIDPGVAENINTKLDRIQERFDDGNCTGDNSAEDALDNLRNDVPIVLEGEDDQFVSDLSEMLDDLGTQIDEQCVEAEDTTTDETTDTTTTDTVEPPTTTETTTTDTTTKDTTDTTTRDTTTNPPDNPGNGNGNGPPAGGGAPGGGSPPTDPGGSGGFNPGRKAGKDDKPPKPKHGKPKDEKKK